MYGLWKSIQEIKKALSEERTHKQEEILILTKGLKRNDRSKPPW